MFDFLIRNATVLDGSGGLGFVADIALAGGRIAAIGKISGDASRTIDAVGLIAAPGFIDIHSHTDATLFIDGRAESKITQGITTELCGNCGFSAAPCLDESGRAELESWRRKHGVNEDWRTLGEMLSALERRPLGVNFATLVGHSNLRAAAVGLTNREASPVELDKMKRCLCEAMNQGAFGMSSGLIYPPSCFADAAELTELARVIARFGGFYATHLRDEHDGLVGAVEEAVELGKRSGASVQISHHKACGAANWGRVKTTLAMISECRETGMDINADQYPYIASATSLSALVPLWAHDGGDAALLERIRSMRQDLLAHIGRLFENDDGWKSVLISSVGSEKNRHCEGMSILDIARQRTARPEDVVLDLLSEEKLAVSMVGFAQCEEDVESVMKSDLAMFGSDACARSLTGELSKGKPHPRAFGTYPRVLGRYVREQGTIELEAAIRKMTSAPARKMGLVDRGLLREGNWADVVLFDADKVSDTATYENPHQISRGIEYVFVNGRLAVENGVLTGEMAGRVLRHSK